MEHAPLTVTHHDHPPQRGVMPVRIEIGDDRVQRAAQTVGGVQDGMLVLYMKSHTWTFVRSAGSFWTSLIISAQRAGLDAVPWTRITGIRPRRYGCIMMRPSPKMLRPARRNPASSVSQTGAPSSASAKAAVGSSSSGTTPPSPCTV